MNKPIKIILGIATLWPILYFFLFFAFVFSQIFFIFSGVDQSGEPSSFFFVIFALHALTIFWIIGLLVIYIVNVFKNEQLGNDQKVLWAILLFVGNAIAMPIYWYLYIWRDSSGEA